MVVVGCLVFGLLRLRALLVVSIRRAFTARNAVVGEVSTAPSASFYGPTPDSDSRLGYTPFRPAFLGQANPVDRSKVLPSVWALETSKMCPGPLLLVGGFRGRQFEEGSCTYPSFTEKNAVLSPRTRVPSPPLHPSETSDQPDAT